MKYHMNKAPMGWNSYDYYDTTVNEAQVKANADFMAKHMKDAGWEYVVVDIQWYAKDAGTMRDRYQYIPFGEQEMDEHGRLLPDVNRFPSSAGGRGFGPLAEYVHGLGLKFGIHIMRGIPRMAAHKHLPILGSDATANEAADPSSICGWNPDMYGVRKEEAGQAYYDSVIGLYAQWGVDYIKCDDICNTNIYPCNPYSAAHEVEMLQHAIEKTGRQIVLSLSPGPALIEKAWHYEKYANMWRITDDFWDRWDLLRNMFDRCELWQTHVAQGSYPDCDMLPLGKLGKGFGNGERDTHFTRDEQMTMMTLWCIFGSPLMVGAELTMLDDWTLWLLTRKEILKLVSNDYVGRQVEKNGRYAVWSCLNEKTGESYLAFFNFLETEQEICCPLGEVEQLAGSIWGQDSGQAGEKRTEGHQAQGMQAQDRQRQDKLPEGRVQELWTGTETAISDGILRERVPGHGVRMFALR